MAAQRTRKSSRAAETSGSNTFFTMGLVTVIALLIVGYVMTQGGFSQLTSEGQGVIDLMNSTIASGDEEQSPAVAPTDPPISQGMIVTNPMPRDTTNSLLTQENLETQYQQRFEQQLQQEKETMNKRIETIRMDYQNQLRDLQLRLEILEMENERLRGE